MNAFIDEMKIKFHGGVVSANWMSIGTIIQRENQWQGSYSQKCDQGDEATVGTEYVISIFNINCSTSALRGLTVTRIPKALWVSSLCCIHTLYDPLRRNTLTPPTKMFSMDVDRIVKKVHPSEYFSSLPTRI